VNKKLKKIIIAILSLTFVWSFCFMIDTIQARKYEYPIFAASARYDESGQAEVFIGVFYKVYLIRAMAYDDDWYEENGMLKREYDRMDTVTAGVVTSWFTKADDVVEKAKKDYIESWKKKI